MITALVGRIVLREKTMLETQGERIEAGARSVIKRVEAEQHAFVKLIPTTIAGQIREAMIAVETQYDRLIENQLDSTSFNKKYKVLKDTADWLSSQKEPDIDQVVPKVEKAMGAYNICKDRLDKVQATLGQYFQKDGTPKSDAPDNGEGVAKKALN